MTQPMGGPTHQLRNPLSGIDFAPDRLPSTPRLRVLKCDAANDLRKQEINALAPWMNT